MSVVYKYSLPLPRVIMGAYVLALDLPRGAEVLSFQCQRDVPFIWARVDPDELCTETREFMFAGTGHGFPGGRQGLMYTFVGTTQTSDGSLVWHLFERQRS